MREFLSNFFGRNEPRKLLNIREKQRILNPREPFSDPGEAVGTPREA
jgi:hypothetical protein